ncbi:MAG: AAA family ATPase [Acidimicrobiia bacterium]|nr:AAA family ATPase [Acidimicrobiia bacterium]
MALIVLTGPPGAGKSTVAAALVQNFDQSVLVEGDAFFGFLASGAIPPWLPESHRQNEIVTQSSGRATGQFAAGGYTTVYDGMVGPWFLPTFAAATGVDVLHYVILFPTIETCLHRVATRSGHGFSDDAATRKMHGEFARAAIDARHVVVDPPPVVQTVDLIVEGIAADRFAYATP